MLTWGIVSGCMALVVGATSFLTLRFLLGVAEAGFFPGVLLYFTYWFPKTYRARVISALFLAVPGSNAVAAAVSGLLLQLDGVLGLAGWQWMFLLESVPAVLLAPVVLVTLTDRPADAQWLRPDERVWLVERMTAEGQALQGQQAERPLLNVLADRRVLALSMIYLTIVTATYGITFFLPLIVKAHGLSNVNTGLTAAVPYVVGTIGMVLWAQSSDHWQERRWHFVVACGLAAIGLISAGRASSLTAAIAAMSVAAVGLYGSKPAFWPLPSTFLTGVGAAAGIAMVNSIGNLGGFVGPYIVGWLNDRTGRYDAALYFLAGCAMASALIALATVRPRHHTAPAAIPRATLGGV
jgi:MFS transporter, ACS family, tartrate transporter